MADDEAGDRRVVGDVIGADHPVGDVLATVALDRARGALLGRVGIEQKRDHHRGLIGRAAIAVGAVIGIERVEVHLRHRVEHEPRQMILRQPLTQRGRHQKCLLPITTNEVLRHHAIVSGGPDGAGASATASSLSESPPVQRRRACSGRAAGIRRRAIGSASLLHPWKAVATGSLSPSMHLSSGDRRPATAVGPPTSRRRGE
jgi:hypothetical protein